MRIPRSGKTHRSRQAQEVRRLLMPLGALCFIAALAGCSDSHQAPSHTLVEWVHATGTCAEQHVDQSFPYEGQFVRWLNDETGRESLYGSVVDQTSPDFFPAEGPEFDAWVESTMEDILREMGGEDRSPEPRRYQRPHMVVFDEIPPSTFESDDWVVVGESEHTPPGDAPTYGYATTCELTIHERRVEMPSTEEWQQIEARWRDIDR